MARSGRNVNNFPAALPPADSDMVNQVSKAPYLFYHLKLRCYVVIELKACDFEPRFINQLNMYQNVVNDILRHPDDKPTIGLLLVKGKNENVVEYSLAEISETEGSGPGPTCTFYLNYRITRNQTPIPRPSQLHTCTLLSSE